MTDQGKLNNEDALKKRIKELEEREEYFRLLTENATDMISRHDPEGVFLYVTSACIAITGYKPEELIGRSVYDFFYYKDLENVRKSHTEIMRAPIVYTVSYRFRHKNGHYVWVEATSKTINNPETGEIREIIATTRNISARKKAEDELKQRFEFERTIGEISMEFLGLSSGEMDRGIQEALATIGTFSGADRAYIFLYHEDGATADNTHEWCAPGIEPQINNLKNIPISKDLPWFSEYIRRGEIFMLTNMDELPREAGSERKHFEDQEIKSLVVVPMILHDRILGFIGFDSVARKRQWSEDDRILLRLFGKFFSHAVERKRIEEKLRESEERWQFALEGSGDGVWDWDAVSDKVFFSERWKKMLGYENHEIGVSLDEWEKRVHPDDMEKALADINRHFSGETEFYQNEHRILCRDGSFKWILDRGKVIEWTEEGKPKRVIGTHSDISARKAAEAEREKLITELQKALKEVKILSGLLPICSYCKKIRNDKGYWQQLEAYISEHSEAEFSHGLCEDCVKKYYPDFKKKDS